MTADPQPLELRVVPYRDACVAMLVAEVQEEYVMRYGGPDATPLAPKDFSPPTGVFLLAVAGPDVVGMAGLRRHADQVAELKRMYVRPTHRRRGHARHLLAAVEVWARAAGYRRLVLETGDAQPEAVALYRSAGYGPTAPFGHCADSECSIPLAKDLELTGLAGSEPAGSQPAESGLAPARRTASMRPRNKLLDLEGEAEQ